MSQTQVVDEYLVRGDAAVGSQDPLDGGVDALLSYGSRSGPRQGQVNTCKARSSQIVGGRLGSCGIPNAPPGTAGGHRVHIYPGAHQPQIARMLAVKASVITGTIAFQDTSA